MRNQRNAVMMYMHTLDGKPASYADMHGAQFLWVASNGHRTRAARLVASLDQIRDEQAACLRHELRDWRERNPLYRGLQPSGGRYGYVLVEVPASPAVRASALAGAR